MTQTITRLFFVLAIVNSPKASASMVDVLDWAIADLQEVNILTQAKSPRLQDYMSVTFERNCMQYPSSSANVYIDYDSQGSRGKRILDGYGWGPGSSGTGTITTGPSKECSFPVQIHFNNPLTTFFSNFSDQVEWENKYKERMRLADEKIKKFEAYMDEIGKDLDSIDYSPYDTWGTYKRWWCSSWVDCLWYIKKSIHQSSSEKTRGIKHLILLKESWLGATQRRKDDPGFFDIFTKLYENQRRMLEGRQEKLGQ